MTYPVVPLHLTNLVTVAHAVDIILSVPTLLDLTFLDGTVATVTPIPPDVQAYVQHGIPWVLRSDSCLCVPKIGFSHTVVAASGCVMAAPFLSRRTRANLVTFQECEKLSCSFLGISLS